LRGAESGGVASSRVRVPPLPGRGVPARPGVPAASRFRRLAVGFGLSLAIVVGPLEAQTITELKAVRFATHGDYTRVVLDLGGPVGHSLGSLSSPDRLYLDLADTRAGPAVMGRKIAVDDTLVRLIRVGQPQVTVTRVVLDLNHPADPDVFWLDAPPRLVVDLRKPAPRIARGPTSPNEPQEEPAPVSRPPAAEAIAAAEPAPPTPSVSSVPEEPMSSVPEEPNRTLRIPRVAQPPKLSDFEVGVVRQTEARVVDFVQRTPGDGVPVSRPTSAYLSYDQDNLYVVFVCAERPPLVRSHIAKREVIAGDDRVSLYLDTFTDHRRAYVFSANAHGVQQDSITTQGQPEDFRFDTVWHAQARRTPHGYVVWMAIPFKSLRFSNRPVQTWGIALGRTIPRKNETAYWPHISRRIQSFTAQLGTLTGIEQVSPTRNVQLIPYGAFTRARLLGSGGSYATSNDSEGGLDAKMVVRNALTFDATLNPDFSQVESDDPQVTINQRYEVFFPEKRPFFLENAGFFQTPINLFFSRRIVAPEFGGRLTGKMGSWALGVLATDDEAAGRQLPPGDPLRGSRAVNGAFRLQRELGRQSTVGVLATTRTFGSDQNEVAALDSRLQLDPNWALTGQFAVSHERRRDGQSLDGTAAYAQLAHAGQHFSYLGSYTDRSPGFRSQLGFIPRVDIRETDQNVGYSWQPRGRSLLNFGPSVSGGAVWNHGGLLQDWYAIGDFAMDFAGPTGFNLSRYEAYELFLGTGFRHYTNDATFYNGQLKWLSVSGSYSWGTGVNYSPPDDIAPFLGNQVAANVGLTLRPGPRLRLDGTFFFTRLATRPGSTPLGVADSGVIFRDQLWRTKINYQFSRALSIRLILDYNDTFTNPTLIAQAPFARWRGDVLLTYLVHPGTALYVGYADRYDSLVVDPADPPILRMTDSPWTSTARQFFVKMSYLFRY
jgi:Domain of unknown function (DUF5916)/AMIN domain